MMPRFRDLPVAHKLTWAVTVTSAVSLLVAVAVFVGREARAFRSGAVDGLWTLAGVVGRNCVAPLLFDDADAARETLGSLAAHPQVQAAWIYTAEGRVFAAYGRDGGAGGPEPPTSLVWAEGEGGRSYRFEGRHLWVVRPVEFRGEPLGRIVIRADLSALRRRLRWGVGIALGVLVLSTLVAYVVSRPFQRLISAPILHLARTMERIGAEGDYGLRLDRGGADEVGILIDGFNRMLTQIQERDARLVRLATVVEQAAEGIAIADRWGRVEYVNPAFERITGYAEQEAVGRHLTSFYPEEEVARQDLAQALERREVWTGRLRAARADGSLYVEECTLSPVRDPSGRVVNYVALRRDVTREVELETHLARAQKLEALGTLAGGIAHDFNNILTPILGHAESALKRVEPDSGAARSLRRIVRAVERAQELVSQILVFSRREDQGKALVPLRKLLNETLGLLRGSIPRNVDLRIAWNTPDDRIWASAVQIQQVVMNLCVNAWHAMEPGGGVLEVSLDRVRVPGAGRPVPPDLGPGEYVVIGVRDTGAGMPPEVLERIFEPFFTTKEVGKGSGLGLSVVHGIVRAHGGGIAVESRPGEGTHFRVFLPAAEAGAAQGVGASAPRGPVRKDGRRGRILVVDDELAVCEFMAQMLGDEGYRVEVATDGAAALRMLEDTAEPFDLVITDQTMPGITGLELAGEVRKRRPGLPVVLCTGYAQSVTPKALSRAGIRWMLSKPISPDDLLAAVREALEGGGGTAGTGAHARKSPAGGRGAGKPGGGGAGT